MRRSRGFTLVEFMVALALGGLLIAGAFQIHAVFNSQSRRQQQLNDIQQSLRVSMQVIERSIRGSGGGMSNGKMVLTPGCSGTRTYYRVQYYNNDQVWPPPLAVGSFDSIAGDADPLPDMLRVITAADAGINEASQINVGNVIVQGVTSTFATNDLLLFMNTQTATALTANGCLRQITGAITAAASPVGSWTVPIANPGSMCANSDTCLASTVTVPTPVRRFRNQTFFRIAQPATGLVKENPKLVMTSLPLGTDPPAAGAVTWSVISDDIEDMQIALLMADGRVCNDVDDPALCDPSTANAIRITLVARTVNSVPGNPPAQTGGYEDRLQADIIPTDGKLRRALTSEITLRN